MEDQNRIEKGIRQRRDWTGTEEDRIDGRKQKGPRRNEVEEKKQGWTRMAKLMGRN